jgi:hypothetical protein
MLLFLVGFVFFQLGLSLFTTLLYHIAGKMLLLGFALLLALGLYKLLLGLWIDIRAYFSQEAHSVRRVLHIYGKKQHTAQLKTFRHQQLHYSSQFKRQRLLAADNQKQLHSLYQAIRQELETNKALMPPQHYQDLYKALRKQFKQADANAMLALRAQIPCR